MTVNNSSSRFRRELSGAVLRGGLSAVLQYTTQNNLDLIKDFNLADAVIKALFRRKMNSDAMRLTLELARGHPNDLNINNYSFYTLYRCGGWKEALNLLYHARNTRAIDDNVAVRIIEGHCLLKIGRIREAHAAVLGITPEEVHGKLRILLNRVVQFPLPCLAPELLKIEATFESGDFAGGVEQFWAIIRYCRHVAAEVSPSRARDVESANYSAAFRSASDADRAGRTIVLLADSISMPRPNIGVNPQDTYPWITQVEIERNIDAPPILEPHCRRGKTIRDIFKNLTDIKPALGLIIQVGIVDCAPRIFAEKDLAFVEKVMGSDAVRALSFIVRNYRSHLEKDCFNSVYVPYSEFCNTLYECLREAKSKFSFILLVNIVMPSRNGERMSRTPFAVNIAKYNAAIRRVGKKNGAKIVDLDRFIWAHKDANLVFSGDDYHFNRLGHEYCSKILYENICASLAKLDR